MTNLIMVTSNVPLMSVPPSEVVLVVARPDDGSLCYLISLFWQQCRNSRMEVTSFRSVALNTWAHGISNDARCLGRSGVWREDGSNALHARLEPVGLRFAERALHPLRSTAAYGHIFRCGTWLISPGRCVKDSSVVVG